MKRRDLLRISDELSRREQALKARFLSGLDQLQQWDTDSLDRAGAYISLLHSQAEHSVEEVVRRLLLHSRTRTEKYRVDGILLNVCVFYGSQFSRSLVEGVIPDRKTLESDASALIKVWDDLGANAFQRKQLLQNHGVGSRYLERLFHPLGICLDAKGFRRVESVGVKKLHSLDTISATNLAEFVSFRGSAVHAGADSFRKSMQKITPGSVGQSGTAAVRLIQELNESIAKGLL